MTTKKQIFSLKALGSLFFIVLLALSVVFIAFEPQVKATSDNYSSIISSNVSGITTNQGTYVYLNGYDIYVTNNNILFYSVSTGQLINNIPIYDVALSGGVNSGGTRILDYNSSCVLIVHATENLEVGGTSLCYAGLAVDLINVNNYQITSWGNNTSILTVGNSGSVTTFNSIDLIFAETNGIYYVMLSASWGGSSSFSLTGLLKIQNSSITVLSSISSANLNDCYLCDSSIWINSQTDLNTIYVLTGNYVITGNHGFSVYKINFVTPSITFIGNDNTNYLIYNDWCYYVDSTYQTINGNVYYSLLFANPEYGVNYEFDVNLLMFNDTQVGNPFRLTCNDINSATTEIRPMACLVASGCYGNNSLGNGEYWFSYTSQNYIMKTFEVQLNNLNSTSPSWSVQGIGQVYALTNKFTSSNNVGGFINVYTATNMLMVDYENNEVCTDYTYVTNPINIIVYTISPTALSISGNGVTPFSNTYDELSSQGSYIFTVTLYHAGNIEQINGFSVYTTGEGTLNTVWSQTPNIIISSNNALNNNSLTFISAYNHTPTSNTIYELYSLNITSLSLGNVPFYFALTWSNSLTVSGQPVGSGGGGTPTPTPTLFGITPEYEAMAIFAVCILGMCIIFFYMKSNNVPWAIAIGLVLAIIICNIINVLGIMIYPLDILTALVIIAIFFLGRPRGNPDQ
jgi:hypothetical protein